MSDRRRQLRQEMGAHLSKQSLVIYVDAQNMPEEQVHGKKRRVTAKKQASSRKSRRVASPPAPRRQQNSSVQQQRQYVRNWQSMVSQRQEQEEEDIDDGYVEEESDVEEVQQQNYRINSSPEPEDDFYEDEDEFGPLILPGPRLISCFKRQNRFSVTGLVRRIVFNEQMTIQEYEIEDGNILAFNPAEGNKRQVAPYVFNGRYTTEEETVSRAYKNLITLPHRDAPVPVMKRYHPNFDNRHSLTELKNEVFESYEAMIEHIEGNSQRRISRWLITDLLLYRLDKRILSNMVVTEIAFPRMPNWLIDDALNKKPDLFPKEISYIFVACGFDFEMQYSRDNSAKPFNFLSKLNEWLQKNVGDKKAVYTKHVAFEMLLYKRMPTIVAITIPEVGDYSGQFEQFNQRLRDHVEMLKERSGPDRAYFDLLDWAELVNQSTDPDDTETVEGRTRLLMEHMANEYGILFNPIAKESDEE
uniref:Uncharacterized protein n=1 Tax=Ditylenchus dipsaci TaxID=166011 RepID=A0A915EQ12_9BILA